MSPESRTESGSGLSLKTLLIAAAASATAAFVVPLIWKPGTVFAAAMSPIIVTVTSELLKRPTETVKAVAKKTSLTPSATARPVEPAQTPHEEFDPLAPPPPEDVAQLRTQTTARTDHPRRRKLSSRQWQVALVTAIVAFVCAVVFVTGSQVLAGKSIGGDNGNSTTFFSGSSRRDKDKDKEEGKETPTPSATPDDRASPTPTPSASPTATPTPTPSAVPTASPTPQAAPAPDAATPVP